MDNIIDIELTGRSTRRDQKLWQYDYGQVLRIAGKEFPKVTEVQFSLKQSGGHTLDRIGTSNNGLLTVQIPNELLQNKGATSDYTIYAFVYLSGDGYGNTKYMIQLPVESRPEPADPSEDPSIDPSIFKDAVNAVNASADRAETAEKSAKESADKAKGYAESAGKSKGDVEKARDNAISAIGTEKESALRGIESKTVESLQKLDGAISNATDAKGNLDKAVQSAGNAKTELNASVGKAGEAKTALDSSIRSAGEKQLALDTTVEQANEVDASLKEQIGSAEQMQANVEQIAKNKTDISLLNEDLADLKDKKITKFYASNQGENHLADSDNGKIQDMMLYGRSSQFTTTGKNLLKYPYIETTKTSSGIMFTDNKDGSINVSGTATNTAYYNLYSNSDGKRLTLASGTYKIVVKGRSKCDVFVNNGVNSAKNEGTFTITDGHNDVWCFIEALKGLAVDETIYPMIQLASITDESYEPYTGGKPSPSPDYPQEIKRVVNPTVKVTNEDGLKVQSATLNNIILNAIPVVSGGNYTDQSGQQWICDEVDLVRGVKVQRVKVRELSPDDKWAYRKLASGNNNFQVRLFNADVAIDGKPCFCNILPFKNVLWSDNIQNLPKIYANDQEITASFPPNSEYSSLEAFKQLLMDVKSVIYYILATPIETPITTDEIAAFNAFTTYYPVTNISVTSDQLDGYTVFNYPISMANGWNYVKQQLGDTRDYIYDMDIQSAEAYVNSEYAVALTELEV